MDSATHLVVANVAMAGAAWAARLRAAPAAFGPKENGVLATHEAIATGACAGVTQGGMEKAAKTKTQMLGERIGDRCMGNGLGQL
jgi:hypothetical protein